MTGLTHLVAFAAMPYWPTVIANDQRIFVVGEKVYAIHGEWHSLPAFVDRKTGKQVSLKDGVDLAKDQFTTAIHNFGPSALANSFAIRGPSGSSQACVKAFKDDVYVGEYMTAAPAVIAGLLPTIPEHLRVGPLPQGVSAAVPMMWIGKNKRPVLLPLPRMRLGQSNSANDMVGPLEFDKVVCSADATDGVHIVGDAAAKFGGWTNAVVWDVETVTPRLLTTSWSNSTMADAVDGDSVVGSAFQLTGVRQAGNTVTGEGITHAVLWKLSSNQVVRLAENAVAYGVRGDIQVGATNTKSNYHAAMWRGSASSQVNLHVGLPAWLVTTSARWVGNEGVIYGIGRSQKNGYFGIEWKPNPLWKEEDK